MKPMKRGYVVVLMVLLVLSTAVPARRAEANDLEKFTNTIKIEEQIIRYVRDAYVDTLDAQTLLDGAVKGMMDELDPHSSYMPYDAAQDFNEKIRGNFEGIGITFSMINDMITVIQVIDGGPSQAAGLKPRDKIVKIDGEDAIGLDQETVKNKLRGPKNSTVTVHVKRPGVESLIPVTIIRDRVNLNSVPHAYMLDDHTGYLAISKFTIKTGYDVSVALDKLRNRGMEKLILDLRSNSGGSLDAAVRVVDQFIGEKRELIVETKGRRAGRDNQKLFTSGNGEFTDIPIVVWINHGSASASEIVAGALQDHDRALIVGQTSFGKGLVMNSFPIKNRGANLGNLILSVAHYYTPSGRLIQRPYDGGRAQYIREGFDDVDPNASDSSKAGKPVFFTDLGREVYGGGGITPDVRIIPSRRLNSLESALIRTNIFFEFVDDYLVRRNDIPEDFTTFLETYRIPDDEIAAFKAFAEKKGITIDNRGRFRDELAKLVRKYDLPEESVDAIEKTLEQEHIDLDLSLFERSREFIEREIRKEIARIVWGGKERFRVWYQHDPDLVSVLACFDQAEELLERRIAMLKAPDGG